MSRPAWADQTAESGLGASTLRHFPLPTAPLGCLLIFLTSKAKK